MKQKKIAFIGGGNMTRAIVGGLLDNGYAAADLLVAEPDDERRAALQADFAGIGLSDDNETATGQAENLVLAVKPQILSNVCRQIAQPVQQQRPLIISIAAGPRSDDIDRWLGGGNAVIRAMPNQPALLGLGVSGMYANAASSAAQIDTAQRILSAIGPVVSVANEQDIDAVTAVSGSGPAYFYLLIDMLAKTGSRLGLDEDSARRLAVETAKGAASLAHASDVSMDELIARVRSPGGTTAAALDSLEDQGVRDIFERAVTAARDRAQVLADQAHTFEQD